jgi:ribosomal protein S18 acetylase RimI-like enzyme
METEIRSGLQPGDIGDITRMHGEVYAREHGLDATFEASVALTLGGLVDQGWPREREGIWVAETGGRRVGSVVLYSRGERLGRLGMLVLRPEQRGAGLGRRLVARCVDSARSAGYEQVELITFSELRTAAHLYREAGFRRVSAGRERRWGRELVMERYLLDLSLRSKR